MNLKNYIGKTFRHPEQGRFTCIDVILSGNLDIMLYGERDVYVPLAECKLIRVVKRKKSQVLVDAIEHVLHEKPCCNSTPNRLEHIDNVLYEAIAAYREKTKGE
jgi:hypothetical protein